MLTRYNQEMMCFEGFLENKWEYITNPMKCVGNEYSTRKVIDRYRIEVSLACDLRCQYCVVYMNDVKQQRTKMSIETANRIIDMFNREVGEKGSIFIMGGEPLTNPSVTKFLIENTCGSSIIFTNAKSLDSEFIDFFYSNNTYILTSLDGNTLEHNAKRFSPNIKENYDIVVRNIKNAILKGCKVGVSCLLHKDNVEDGVQIADFFIEELGAKAMSFAYPHLTMTYSEENEFEFTKYLECLKNLYLISKKHKVYIDQIGKILASLYYSTPMVIGCKAGTSQRTFYPDGKETICTKIDTQEGFELEKYLKNVPYNNPMCKGCIAKNLCAGECQWDYLVAQRRGKTHERICGYRKELIRFITDDIKMELGKAATISDAKKRFNELIVPMINNYN